MTESDAFRRAVIADPDDDTPRLVYADWLEEHRQTERAVFIRAQIEAARAEPFSKPARDAELSAIKLLDSHRYAWTRHIAAHCVDPPRFGRGFIEHVAVEPVTFVAMASRFFNTEPITSLRVKRPEALMNEWVPLTPLLQLPQMRHIRSLEFACRMFDFDEYTTLLSSPHLANVQKLSFRGMPIQPSWLAELFGSPAFPRLAELDLAGITNLGPGLVRALSRGRHRVFRALDISEVMLSSEQLQKVLGSPCMREVEDLRLGYSGRGEAGPLFHLDIGWGVLPLKSLKVLDLTGQRLGDDAVRAIASQPEARQLRWLGLANNELSADSIYYLCQSKHLALNSLDVRGNQFTAAHIAQLQERFPGALISSSA
jgi:uncharacterized protein (TIGR02996 family)